MRKSKIQKYRTQIENYFMQHAEYYPSNRFPCVIRFPHPDSATTFRDDESDLLLEKVWEYAKTDNGKARWDARWTPESWSFDISEDEDIVYLILEWQKEEE